MISPNNCAHRNKVQKVSVYILPTRPSCAGGTYPYFSACLVDILRYAIVPSLSPPQYLRSLDSYPREIENHTLLISSSTVQLINHIIAIASAVTIDSEKNKFIMSGVSNWIKQQRKGELIELADSIGLKQ